MEKWHVIGYRDLDFKDDSGRDIKGTSLFVTRLGESPICGEECLKLFIPATIEFEPVIGSDILVYFNRRGRVSGVEVIS